VALKRTKAREAIVSGKFLNFNSSEEINNAINACQRIMATENIPEALNSEIASWLRRCIYSYIRIFLALKSNKSRAEFRDASKRHQRTLNSILSLIVQSFKTEGYETHITFDKDVVTVNVSTLTMIEEKVTPRSFYNWYNCLIVISKINNITPNQMGVICRMMTTVFNLVNNTALNQSEKDDMTKQLVEQLSAQPKYSTIDDYTQSIVNSNHQFKKGIDDIKETIQLIKKYCSMDIRQVPIWARSMVRSLKLVHLDKRLYVYDNIHPMMSLNSTCSSMISKGKRVTIPGVFASCIEPDYFKDNYPDSKFDNLINFNQKYKIDMSDIITEKVIHTDRRFSVSIDQKKPKPRIIHPLNNSEQDRLKYFHTLMEKVLINMQEDCTFNQYNGPQHIKYVMDNESKWAIYSLDLTSATDTFNIGLQYLIIKELIFYNNENADVLASTWLDIMTSKTRIDINRNRIEFLFSNGQPQGFLSSFPAFSLEHHIVMLTVLRKFNESINSLDFYRVLGDDSLITCEDPEFIIPDLYIYYINAANVECNKSKGYLFNPNNQTTQVKIAEFAKYLIIDGIELTPIPFKLLTDVSDISGNIALAAWYSNHSAKQWSIENLKFFIGQWDEWYLKYYSPIIDTMVYLTIPGIFLQSFENKLSRIVQGVSIDDISIIQFLLLNTIIYSVIDKLVGSKNIQPGIKGLIHVKNELLPFLESIDEQSKIDPQNKISILKLLISNKYYTFVELCNKYSSLSELDNETLELVSMLIFANSTEFVQNQVEQIFNSLDLLTIDPKQIDDQEERDLLANRMLKIFKDFSITVDRSWSNFGRYIPIDFLHKSMVELDKLLSKEFTSLDEYVQKNNFIIEPSRVKIGTDDFGNFNTGIEGFLESVDEADLDILM